MTLFDHTQIIKRWAASCEKTWQLDLFGEIIKNLIIIRFKEENTDDEIKDSIRDINDLIDERRLIIGATASTTSTRHDENNIGEIP